MIRDAQLAVSMGTVEQVRFVSLTVDSSIARTITTKNFLWQTSYGRSLVALEYRVADGNSKLLAKGIEKNFDVQKLPTKK